MTVVRQYGFVGYAFHVKSGPHPWIRFISQQVGYVSCYIPLYTHHIPINNIMLYPQYIPIVYPLLPPNHPTLTIFGLETHRDLGILHFKKPPYYHDYTYGSWPFPLFMIVHPQLVSVISDLFPYFRILHADPQRWSHSVLERNVRRNHVHSRRLPGFITKENG